MNRLARIFLASLAALASSARADGVQIAVAAGFEKDTGHKALLSFGAAAMETMKALGVAGTLAPKFVRGENIVQTYPFVATGNALLKYLRSDKARAVIKSFGYDL